MAKSQDRLVEGTSPYDNAIGVSPAAPKIKNIVCLFVCLLLVVVFKIRFLRRPLAFKPVV